jgi:hypothetical protein
LLHRRVCYVGYKQFFCLRAQQRDPRISGKLQNSSIAARKFHHILCSRHKVWVNPACCNRLQPMGLLGLAVRLHLALVNERVGLLQRRMPLYSLRARQEWFGKLNDAKWFQDCVQHPPDQTLNTHFHPTS